MIHGLVKRSNTDRWKTFPSAAIIYTLILLCFIISLFIYLYFPCPVVSCKRVPTAGTTQVQETNHDLLLNFRRLTLSPTEAYLSSRVQAKAPASPLKNATDYR